MRTIPGIRLLLLVFALLLVFPAAWGQIGISITIGPPALPVYEQPLCPGEGYIWTPGYWAYDYDAAEYYWVPGTWVLAPEPGLLWTPPWWEWRGAAFVFHEGYWGPHVGFYGGISYGFGYFGVGYEGGRWQGNRFYYNRSVSNVNVTNIHNVYNTTVINQTTINRVSYNGGTGGIQTRPTQEQEAAERERHVQLVAAQTQHIQAARSNPQLRESANQGKPSLAATARPGDFKGREVVHAKQAGAPYRPVAERKAAPRETPVGTGAANNVPRPPGNHASDLQSHERPAAPNTGNPKVDQKYQQQQNKLYSRMDQEHQKLQQKQNQEHQRLEQKHASDAQRQQMEQRHQQQTQQMEQKHQQEIQRLQNKQARPPHK